MKLFTLIGLIPLILLSACDSTQQEWADARAAGSIEAYQAFIDAHPEHPLADSARAALEELRWFDYVRVARNIPAFREFRQRFPASAYGDSLDEWTEAMVLERHPSLREAETVSIRLFQDLGGAEDERFNIYNKIGPHLECAGLDVVEDADAEPDLLVDIRVVGRALSARYGFSGQRRYTGADVSGTVSLIAAGQPVMSRRFRWTNSPPESHLTFGDGDYTSVPSDAPFIGTFEQGFYPVWTDLLDQAFGPSTLRGILEMRPHSRSTETIIDQLIRHDTDHFIEYVAARQQREDIEFEAAMMMRDALVAIGEPGMETMVAGLRAPSLHVRKLYLEALQLSAKDAVGAEFPLVRRALDHLDEYQRGFDGFVSLLSPENPRNTRGDVIAALRELGWGASVPHLTPLLEDEDEEIRTAAWGALRSILESYLGADRMAGFPAADAGYDAVVEWMETTFRALHTETDR